MIRNSGLNRVLIGIFVAAALAAAPAGSALAKKDKGGGGGNAGGGNSGEPEPVYSATDDFEDGSGNPLEGLIDEPAPGVIDSTNLSFDDIIFRPEANFTFDLSGFPVSDPDSGGSCVNFGKETGTLVLTSGDSAAPGSAELRFGFQGQLSGGGKTVQHFLVMSGAMVGDWPPTSNGTELTFTNWALAAENKRSQKSDCEGDGALEYVVDVWLSSP
jgi:hypothetical protein